MVHNVVFWKDSPKLVIALNSFQQLAPGWRIFTYSKSGAPELFSTAKAALTHAIDAQIERLQEKVTRLKELKQFVENIKPDDKEV